MNYNAELYNTVIQFKGLKEIPGPKDEPIIILAHKLCGEGGSDADHTIPWCSSFMNLMVLITNCKLNPFRAYQQMKFKNIPEKDIITIFTLAGKDDISMLLKSKNYAIPSTKLLVPAPTFSSGAISWTSWGIPIPRRLRLVGDIVVLTRDGGNHVALFDSHEEGRFLLVGGNQHDMVCSADWYDEKRVLGYRRVTV